MELPVHPTLRLLAAPDSAAADDALSPLLGPADHERSAARRHPEARRRTRIGRGLLRLLAGDLLALPPESILTGASPGGAPYARAPVAPPFGVSGKPSGGAGNPVPEPLPATPPEGAQPPRAVVVSVTHTRGLVAVAASLHAARLGVDVERLDRNTRPEAIARRHFLEAEVQALLALPSSERRTAFLCAWTLKESWGKAAGVAIPTALTRIAFDLDPSRFPTGPAAPEHCPLSISAPHSLPPASRWRFWTTTHTDFTLAVTAGYPPSALRHRPKSPPRSHLIPFSSSTSAQCRRADIPTFPLLRTVSDHCAAFSPGYALLTSGRTPTGPSSGAFRPVSPPGMCRVHFFGTFRHIS